MKHKMKHIITSALLAFFVAQILQGADMLAVLMRSTGLKIKLNSAEKVLVL